jgi:hypothetical protein
LQDGALVNTASHLTLPLRPELLGVFSIVEKREQERKQQEINREHLQQVRDVRLRCIASSCIMHCHGFARHALSHRQVLM